MDFLTVPTATFGLLYVLVILSHERREIVHLNVTSSPNADWIAQQIAEAFPYDTPRFLLRDNDKKYGHAVKDRIKSMGIEDVTTAFRSPWQNPYCERVIGSIRRECLDHVIVMNEKHLRRVLSGYVDNYHGSRTHQSLNNDCPTMHCSSLGYPCCHAVLGAFWETTRTITKADNCTSRWLRRPWKTSFLAV